MTDVQVEYEPREKYAHVPRRILAAEVSTGARLLWAALASYSWNRGTCFPSQKTIGDLLGVDVRTVRRWTTELEGAGFVEVVRPEFGRGKAIIYRLLEGGAPVRLSDAKGGGSVRRKGAAVSAQEQHGKPTTTTTGDAGELLPLSEQEKRAVVACQLVADAKGVRCRDDSVLRATRQFQDRDITAEAESFEFWFRDGGGEKSKVSNVAQTWRNWLARSPTAQEREAAVARKGRKKESRSERLNRDLDAIRRLKEAA